MTKATADSFAGLSREQEKHLIGLAGGITKDDPVERDERRAIQEESRNAEKRIGLTDSIREFIEGTEGPFDTRQLYDELGIRNPKDKSAVRMALSRLKGTIIQAVASRAGCYRRIEGDIQEMDLVNVQGDDVSLWLPLDLHNVTTIMPGNIIVVTGDPDAGKTAFLLRTIRENLANWECNYFNSEMGSYELRKRLDLFNDFPIGHKNFHAFERSDCFEDVIRPGNNVLNVVDYLEVTEEFFSIGKHLNSIHKNLQGAVAIIAIQKRSKNSDMPLGAQRALEKPRLAIALSAGNRSEPNKATILKCKNRKTEHSMIGKSRPFKLIGGCMFRPEGPVWK